MESLLRYLADSHPEAFVDAMCTGPERLKSVHGIEATPRQWQLQYEGQSSGVAKILVNLAGLVVEAFRTGSWVRRHDVVMVPGMGVLEATLQVRRTKVALVSVGADTINQPITRWLSTSAARLASFRSYRDQLSRGAMAARGLDTTGDQVYPDLAFATPVPAPEQGDTGTIGIGVMAYYGSNDDRERADEIYLTYVEKMKAVLRRLVDDGRRIRLFVGDSASDAGVVEEFLADIRAYRPDLDSGWIVAVPVLSFEDVIQAIRPVGSVIAIRYHSVLCALLLAKPTMSISYAKKHDVLMADMGLSEFCQPVNSLDVDRLLDQLRELEGRAAEVSQMLQRRVATKVGLLDDQFDQLSALLFESGDAPRLQALASPTAS
jgi:polysaccharide pyruvyl transferase WcaK-like protein